MIKVTLKDGQPQKEVDFYPCIKKAKNDRVVLFTAPGAGYELVGAMKYSHGFLRYVDNYVESAFELYDGIIELQNQKEG